MKRFIWLLLLAAAGYAVWKYYPQIERMARERTAGETAQPAVEEVPPAPGTRATTSAPPSAAFPPAAVLARAAVEDDIATRYPLPEFRTIEALTGEWKKIPPSAFPRQVTLQAAVSLQLAGGAGSARFEPGAKVIAVSAEGDQLTVTPSIGAAVRGTINIDQTDFKKLLGVIYEQFKDRKRAEVTKLRQQAREAAKKTGQALATVLSAPGPKPSAAAQAKLGPRPEQRADQTVPIMLASISERNAKKKESEPKLADIHGWGIVRYREVDGEPFWAGSVRYTARTIFGEFPTEAVALMRRGKVVKWIYSGTGEPVP